MEVKLLPFTKWYCTISKEWDSVVSGFQMIHRVSILPKDLFAWKVNTFVVGLLLAPNQRRKEILWPSASEGAFFSLSIFSFASSRVKLWKNHRSPYNYIKKKKRMKTPSAMEKRANEKFLSLTRVSISFGTKDIQFFGCSTERERVNTERARVKENGWHKKIQMTQTVAHGKNCKKNTQIIIYEVILCFGHCIYIGQMWHSARATHSHWLGALRLPSAQRKMEYNDKGIRKVFALHFRNL